MKNHLPVTFSFESATKKSKFVADSRFLALCQLIRVRAICHGGRLFLYSEEAVRLRALGFRQIRNTIEKMKEKLIRRSCLEY